MYGFLFYVLKHTYGRVLRWRFAVRATGRRMLASLEPPYLLLSNHVNMWDPPLVGIFLKHPPRFMATDNMFRTTLSRLLYRLVGAIPKSKDQPDLAAVIAARRAAEQGAVIAVFPEGRRTWDGRTLPLHPATARLPRLLKTPVVVADIDGGYLSRPRWARTSRRGRIVVRYRRILTARDAGELTEQEIERRVSDSLERDADAAQRRARVRYRGRRLAEHIELFLVRCPCGAHGSYRSRGNRFWCAECGRTGTFGELGTIDGYDFRTVSELSDWQHRTLDPELVSWPASGRVLRQAGVRLLRAVGRHSHRPVARGEAVLTTRSIRVDDHSVPLELVHACNMQNDNSIEFTRGRYRYRLEQPPRRVQYHRAPYYLWMRVMQECSRALREPPQDLAR